MATIFLLAYVSHGKLAAPESKTGLAIVLLVFPIGVVLLLYGLLTENTIFRSIISSKIVEALGRGSYAFFLIHAGIIPEFVIAFLGSENVLLLYVIIYLISMLAYWCIEKPLRELIVRPFKQQKISSATA